MLQIPRENILNSNWIFQNFSNTNQLEVFIKSKLLIYIFLNKIFYKCLCDKKMCNI